MSADRPCPDCSHGLEFDRRVFLKTASAAAAAAAIPSLGLAREDKTPASETHVKKLYDALTDEQRKVVCFAWDHTEGGDAKKAKAKAKGAKARGGRGLLRTHVSNNWSITTRSVNSSFYSKDQQELVRTIFEGIFQPDWLPKIDKQLKDDTGGEPWGAEQSIAIFGKPGDEKFEFVMTGRHLTIRCDGNSTEHMAFGGPIFYGHAASGFDEKVGHPDNVFWYQALEANKVFEMLDGKQRKKALLTQRPAEASVSFRGSDGMFPGAPVAEMTSDQKGQVEKILAALLDPYRTADQEEVRACLKAQGGLDKCSLAFYSQGDLGDDGEWDNWRLEGPSFVWYFRGTPHVHVWVNIADSPKVKLNARG